MPLPSSTPRNPSPSRSGKIQPVLEARADPESQPDNDGLAVIDAVLDDDLHPLHKEHPYENSEVCGGNGSGDSYQQGREFWQERHRHKDDTDYDSLLGVCPDATIHPI